MSTVANITIDGQIRLFLNFLMISRFSLALIGILSSNQCKHSALLSSAMSRICLDFTIFKQLVQLYRAARFSTYHATNFTTLSRII